MIEKECSPWPSFLATKVGAEARSTDKERGGATRPTGEGWNNQQLELIGGVGYYSLRKPPQNNNKALVARHHFVMTVV